MRPVFGLGGEKFEIFELLGITLKHLKVQGITHENLERVTIDQNVFGIEVKVLILWDFSTLNSL
jgi:hypothetical protein